MEQSLWWLRLWEGAWEWSVRFQNALRSLETVCRWGVEARHPFFLSLQPLHVSCTSCHSATNVWDIHLIHGLVDYLLLQHRQSGIGFSPNCPAVSCYLPTPKASSPKLHMHLPYLTEFYGYEWLWASEHSPVGSKVQFALKSPTRAHQQPSCSPGPKEDYQTSHLYGGVSEGS